ncbi:MAG: hypothetical protein OXG37_14930 [Actinomycetia bacterium]|nr:hypothetical protein [Actinomycetes bacterium]
MGQEPARAAAAQAGAQEPAAEEEAAAEEAAAVEERAPARAVAVRLEEPPDRHRRRRSWLRQRREQAQRLGELTTSACESWVDSEVHVLA